jgi:hypothetical protein
MPESEIYYPEDGEWTQEDVDRFIESVEEQEVETGGGGDEVKVSAGTILVAIFLFFIIVYSIYVQQFQFAGLNCILLVALALGNKAIE